MFLVRVVMIVLCGVAFLPSVLAQKEAKNPSVVLLDEKAPGAYITYLESYTSEYRAREESGRRAIFRFHNNYRFPVQVSVYNVEDEDMAIEQLKAKVNVVGIVYDLFQDTEARQPRMVRRFAEEVMTIVSIDPGEDLYFSVPVEHLTSHSEIWIPFDIESETNATKGGLPPQHFAVFWGSHMPEVRKQKK